MREIPVIDIEGFLAGDDMTTVPQAVEAAASSVRVVVDGRRSLEQAV